MGHITFRVFRDVEADRLATKVRDNLALWEAGMLADGFRVFVFAGAGCSALRLSIPAEEALFFPIGAQLGAVWMDVRYQDGDSWDVSVYEGAQHLVSHSVNPWAHVECPRLRHDHVGARIERICQLWPRYGASLEPYLQLWYYFEETQGGSRIVEPRRGKAYATDRAGYGDADQYWDFLSTLGLRIDRSEGDLTVKAGS